MNSSAKTKTTLELLTEKCDDIKHQKKLITKDFENLKDIVKKSGIVCLVCFLIQVIIVGSFLSSKNASVYALGRFLTPFILMIFLIALYIFLNRGFDFFVNVDTKYSKKLAKKLDRFTVTEKLDDLNNAIMRLELEIKRQEDSIYERNYLSTGIIEDTYVNQMDVASAFYSQPQTVNYNSANNYNSASEDYSVTNNYHTVNSYHATSSDNMENLSSDIENEDDWEIEFIDDFGIEFIDDGQDNNTTQSNGIMNESERVNENDDYMFDMLIKRAEVQQRVKAEEVPVGVMKTSSLTGENSKSGNRNTVKNSGIDDILNGLDEIGL